MTKPDEKFTLHPDPVWKEKANFIVNAPLPEEGRFEQLWCRQVSVNIFEVCCIPFFLYNVALGDVVETRQVGERKYVVSRVLQSSGRYVFRVHFGRTPKSGREETVEQLEALGALLEWSSPTLLAVDTRDHEHAQRVANFLQERQDLGALMFETGK